MTAPNAKPRAGEHALSAQHTVESWLAHCDDSREVPTAEIAQLSVGYIALAAQSRELVEALAKSADSFRDLRIALNVLGRPVSAQACEIAEHGARALLAKVRP